MGRPDVITKRFTLKQLIDRAIRQLTGVDKWRLEKRKGRMEVKVEVPKDVDAGKAPS